jgi:enolase
MRIKHIQAREILDSRGNPTLSTKLVLETGEIGIGKVPSGASTGKTEVLELRDNDLKRYRGKGVLSAIETINNLIAPQILKKEFLSQESFDQFLIDLDGTELKTNFGGNSILSLSMAFARAAALAKKQPLYEYFAHIYWRESFKKELIQMPEPLMLVFEGGSHANWVTDIQEYMIIPKKKAFPKFSEAVRAGSEIFHNIEDLLHEKGYTPNTGLEGAFAPHQIKSNKETFEIICEGVERAGYKLGEEITFAVDIAASEFYDTGTNQYMLKSEEKVFNKREWIEFQKDLFSKFPVEILEDPMDQEDWDGWKEMTTEFGKEKSIVGDDLLTTNVKRIEKAKDFDAVNSVLIKLNQIGTVTETMRAMRMSENAGYSSIISHRSGETNDSTIADLAVGSYAKQCKFGATNRGERIAKYNRLLEIESELSI